MMYLIWVAEIVLLGAILYFKSKEAPRTQEEIEREWNIVEQRKDGFLMKTTNAKAFNGMEG